MQVQIEFLTGGASSVFGNFAPGDLLRCDAAAAKHFVEEARCAKYLAAPEKISVKAEAVASVPAAVAASVTAKKRA